VWLMCVAWRACHRMSLGLAFPGGGEGGREVLAEGFS